MYLAKHKFIAELLHLMETKIHSAKIGKDITGLAPSKIFSLLCQEKQIEMC